MLIGNGLRNAPRRIEALQFGRNRVAGRLVDDQWSVGLGLPNRSYQFFGRTAPERQGHKDGIGGTRAKGVDNSRGAGYPSDFYPGVAGLLSKGAGCERAVGNTHDRMGTNSGLHFCLKLSIGGSIRGLEVFRHIFLEFRHPLKCGYAEPRAGEEAVAGGSTWCRFFDSAPLQHIASIASSDGPPAALASLNDVVPVVMRLELKPIALSKPGNEPD